jgi:hypothetical protein
MNEFIDSIYKYGLPPDITEEELKLLREKISKIQKETIEMLKDPEFIRRNKFNATITGRLSTEDLTCRIAKDEAGSPHPSGWG